MSDGRPVIAVPLTSLALIEARGPEASAFLQGQLSNDVRQVRADLAQLTSYNSPKGRMLAVLHLFKRDDAFLLEIQRSLLEATLKRLKMYVLRSKVTLAEASGPTLFGLAGPDTAKILGELGLPAPAAPLACAWIDGVCVTRRIGDAPRYTVLAPAGGDLWDRIRARAAEAGIDDWRRLDIEAGVPTVYPETQDHFVAQMCNLDALGGVSFDKGCYTGQEVIARVHYRGAVRRHMSKQRLDGPVPRPGTKLAIGEVVDAVPRDDGGCSALIVAVD